MSSTESSLRVAVIGAGLMGRWHAHYARRHGAEVVAIVDSAREAAQSLARRAGGAAAFEDALEMLRTTKPRVVHICTPLASHLALATQALEAGAHALVEKPLAAALVETRDLLQAASARGLHVCPVHQFAFQRGVSAAAAALPSLGEPLHASFTICSAGGEGLDRGALDGIVADVLPHPLSVLQALWPRNALRAADWTVQDARAGELHLRGASGTLPVSAWISMSARPTRCEMELACSGGSVHVNFFHGYAAVRRGAPSRADKIAQPFRIALGTLGTAASNLAGRAWRRELAYPGLPELIGAFYAAALGRGPNPVPAESALAVAEVREHLLRERERARAPS